ncbi:MAG: Rieske (2Fe-2S) protein [Beijerinckiaceae bacterium]
MAEVRVARFEDIADGDHRVFAAGKREVGVFRVGEAIYAWENHCPHAGGPVCQGKIFPRVDEALDAEKKSLGLRFSSRRNIVCPWHGFEFDIETGIHPGDPSVRLRRIVAEVRDGDIVLTLPG